MTKIILRYIKSSFYNTIGDSLVRFSLVNGCVFKIEAKLGTIIDNRTKQRLSLPVCTETGEWSGRTH